jgi:hypothetical protein
MTIATPLNPVLPPSHGTDRRHEPRTPYRADAQLLRYPPARHPHIIDVAVVDYSDSGIGIIYSEGLLIGQLFVVREPHVTRGHTCLYTVVRCERCGQGGYSIGLHVLRPLSAEEDEWAPFTPPPAPGLDLGTKLLYLTFAIAGAVTIVLLALLWRR